MTLRKIYDQGRFGLSFEIFPPKTPEGDEALRASLRQLATWRPSFISCTYGAGGSTSKRTVEWCCEIQRQFSLNATAHLTCFGSSRNELLTWLELAVDAGIQNIMALRGDIPKDRTTPWAPDGFRYAHELVALIRERFPKLGVGVAGYPEKHPEARDAEADFQHLLQKVNAGADAIYTQLFFDNERFFRFRDRLQNAGVTIPIIPGIMPVTEFERIKRITSLCGSAIPSTLARQLKAAKHDRAEQFGIGVEFAIGQCRELLHAGVPGIHFYVLNKSDACQRLLQEIRLPDAQVPI